MKIAIFRKAHFNAAHRLHNPEWDDDKNEKIFGVCNNPNYHGHNYEVEVCVIGKIQQETGYVMDLSKLKSIIEKEIIRKLDHKNLNLDVDYFKEVIPSAEHICIYCYNQMRNKLPSDLDLVIKLWETPRNYVQFPPPNGTTTERIP